MYFSDASTHRHSPALPLSEAAAACYGLGAVFSERRVSLALGAEGWATKVPRKWRSGVCPASPFEQRTTGGPLTVISLSRRRRRWLPGHRTGGQQVRHRCPHKAPRLSWKAKSKENQPKPISRQGREA